jgi:hypothetical protein
VIVPLLLSNAERPWSAARSLSELYAAPVGVLAALGPHLLDVSLRIDDLPAQSSVSLRARAGLHHFGRIALFALQRAHTAPDFVAELAGWMEVLRSLLATPQGLEDFALLMRYMYRTADFPSRQLRELVRELGPKAEEVAMTAAERLKAEGRVEGKADGRVEGRAEGKAEGKVAGQAELLLKLLSLRFGELPDAARARVGGASVERLAIYAERVLTATSLDEVLR